MLRQTMPKDGLVEAACGDVGKRDQMVTTVWRTRVTCPACEVLPGVAGHG